MKALLKQLLRQLKKECCILLLLLIGLLLLAIHSHQQPELNLMQRIGNCYLPENYPSADAIYRLHPLNALPDVLRAERPPLFRRTIFYLDTSCSLPPRYEYNRLQLSASQACAIESAALLNPMFDVFVLYANPRYYSPEQQMSPLLEAILSYYNVQLRSLNLYQFAVDTPIEDWLRTDEIFQSSNPAAHISFLLRLLVLHRFGGVYVDFDVLHLRNLMNLPGNYLGAQSEHLLAGDVISMAPTGIGHEFITECLNDFRLNFDAQNWRNYGVEVIRRVASKFCGTQNVTKMLEVCKRRGVQIHDWFAFYPIQQSQAQDIFDPRRQQQIVEQTNGSHLLHLWNKSPNEFNTHTAYGQLAKLHCPKVYEAARSMK